MAAAAATSLVAATPAWAAVNMCNVAIPMSDGVVLRADLTLPASTGRFPLIFTASAYNKGTTEYGTSESPSQCRGASSQPSWAAGDGFATLTLDERGTGASGGFWDRWSPRTQQDYAEVLDWIQAQPWSNGRVAGQGDSYNGTTSLYLAQEDARRVAEGKPQAVYALWVQDSETDTYRNWFHIGGAVNTAYPVNYQTADQEDSLAPPTTVGDDPNAAQIWLDHQENAATFFAPYATAGMDGGSDAYDGPFFAERAAGKDVGKFLAPVGIVGGWYDLYQDTDVDLYQQLYADRHLPPGVERQMKKVFYCPCGHGGTTDLGTAAKGYSSIGAVEQAWLDHWVKGVDNGVQNLPSVNLWNLGSGKWESGDTWPGQAAGPFYLNGNSSGSATSVNDGGLSTSPPATAGADSIPYSPVAGPCTESYYQWQGQGGGSGQCQTDDRQNEANELTYTTAPLTDDTQITGDVVLKLWIELTKPDALLAVKLLDVAGDGTARPISLGYQVASMRALDPAQTTYGPHGEIAVPYHPYTQESQQPVDIGTPTELVIRILPTDNTFLAGHRIRLAIGTADPWVKAPAPWEQNMLGGTVTVLHGPQYPSSFYALPVGS